MTRTTNGNLPSTPSAALAEDLRVVEGRCLELRETHISWVFLDDQDVWKVKKPVSLGFLDFSTREKRRAACEAEVRLNRRLTPDVYRGVVPILREPGGRHRLGSSDEPDEPVDWAVHMVRLPDAARADERLRVGTLGRQEMERIAARLVAFHKEARCDDETGRFGSLEVILGNVRENFAQTRDTIQAYLSRDEAKEIEAWQNRFLAAEAERFECRVHNRQVRDGHGDLRLDHIYLGDDGRISVIDCIEFNRRFRFADVCADIAFLAMDLTWRGRPDLAEGFLAAYAREADDYGLYPLVDFYESYRAYVRAKVATFLANDRHADPATRERAAREARRFFLLALASERRSLVPAVVVAVGGIIASGKSTVAARIAAEMAAPVISSDRTRKHLLGVRPDEKVRVPAFQGPYGAVFSQKVYEEVLRRAGGVLVSGRPVILDASFRSRSARAAARRLAAEHGVPFYFIECRASRETCVERLDRRAREGDVSDGRHEIFDEFIARWESVDELPGGHLVLDTSQALATTVESLRRKLPVWPAGLA